MMDRVFRRGSRISIFRFSFLALFSLFLVACETNNSKEKNADLPPHHTSDGFRNLYVAHTDKNIFDFLAVRFFGDLEWADHEGRAAEVPIQNLDVGPLSTPPNNIQISWLGHSTFLIQKNGINILTDPIFADRASPVPFAGPKRYVRHVIDYSELPNIDYVVISHNHYDHLDSEAVRDLGNEPKYLVPLGLQNWFEEQGVKRERIIERDWWDTSIFEALTIQAMPSQHWSARGLFDRHETLWASWLIRFPAYSVWFAGDTGYNPYQFKEIGEKAGNIDLSLIPIGGYEPRSFMKTYHVNPEEAVKIHKDIGAKKSYGMHWGTFPLTAEGPIDPKVELERQVKDHNLEEKEFETMSIGETVILKKQDDNCIIALKVRRPGKCLR